MAANLRAETLEPRELPSPDEATEPQALSVIADVDGPQSDVGHGESPESPDEGHEAIARSAYFLAEARGFEPGHELDDWLAAERQATTR